MVTLTVVGALLLGSLAVAFAVARSRVGAARASGDERPAGAVLARDGASLGLGAVLTVLLVAAIVLFERAFPGDPYRDAYDAGRRAGVTMSVLLPPPPISSTKEVRQWCWRHFEAGEPAPTSAAVGGDDRPEAQRRTQRELRADYFLRGCQHEYSGVEPVSAAVAAAPAAVTRTGSSPIAPTSTPSLIAVPSPSATPPVTG